MDIRILKYFLAVVQEESINGAANFLHVSQPTLSRQLMDLEEELGQKLFIRGNRKITLTESGIFLRKRAEEILTLLEKTEAEFHTANEIISGDIFIGGGETKAMNLLAHVMKRFQSDYPQVRYHLFSGNADDVAERLDKGLLDFGILIAPADISKYDFIRIPSKDVWGLLMRKDCSLAEKSHITPVDLAALPLITSRQSLVNSTFSDWLCSDINDSLNIVATYNLVYNASIMVEENIGYAVCLEGLINTTGSSELCFRPLYPPLEASLNIVWKKYQIFSHATQKLLEYMKKLNL